MNFRKILTGVSLSLLLQAVFSLNYSTTATEEITQGRNDPPQKIVTESGLLFEKESAYRLQDSSYSDIIQLKNLSDNIQALQFRLSFNRTIGDSTILIFDSLQKGQDVISSDWSLNYNVIKGPVLPNGASEDSIYVLLYNTNQNGGLLPGDYDSLFKVTYRVADLPEIHDSLKSSLRISHAEASTYQGMPVDVTPSRAEFKIFLRSTVPLPDHGLIFEKDSVYRLEDNSYTDILQLKSIEAKLQALQFRLSVNKSFNDNPTLTFENIEKGSNISDPSWVLNYNVFRGPLTSNGASLDSIYVLLYNLNQDGGLPEGDYNNLLKVNYRVSDLQALQDSVKSSFKISNAEASTFQGYPINIAPSRDELSVIALNRVGFYGDVNGDGCLDILDILMIVDHIVGRDSLQADEFERADIAPWLQGAQDPDPDGIVNVQDLSLLQNIILTGIYPSGVEINGCSYASLNKVNGQGEAGAKIYVHNKGITVYLNSDIDIRGVQFEFGNVSNKPDNMVITTDVGQGYYFYTNKLLRVLLYDRLGTKVFTAGEGLLADLPFSVSNPGEITIEKLILVDKNRNKITNGHIEIIYDTPPSIPLDYILEQNYPNPFNPLTTIEYSIPNRSLVILKIYDLLGNEVAVPVNEVKNRGVYSVIFNPENFSSGVYFYRISASSVADAHIDFVQTKKMMLIK